MIYFVLATLLVFVIIFIYFKSKKGTDKGFLIKAILIISVPIFFTYISKTIFIHKPIFIVHLALLILSWGGALNFIKNSKSNYFMIFSPIITTILFLILAIFFKEFG